MVAAPTKNAASPTPVSTRAATRNPSDSTTPYSAIDTRHDGSADDDEDAPAESVAQPPDVRPQQHRADEQRSHGDPDADVAAAEAVLDVLGHDGEHGAEREEVREPRADHRARTAA